MKWIKYILLNKLLNDEQHPNWKENFRIKIHPLLCLFQLSHSNWSSCLGACHTRVIWQYRGPSLYAVFLSAILHICKWKIGFFLEPILLFMVILSLFICEFITCKPTFIGPISRIQRGPPVLCWKLYRVCQWFRLMKRDDYFQVNFFYFEIEQCFWRQLGQ